MTYGRGGPFRQTSKDADPRAVYALDKTQGEAMGQAWGRGIVDRGVGEGKERRVQLRRGRGGDSRGRSLTRGKGRMKGP